MKGGSAYARMLQKMMLGEFWDESCCVFIVLHHLLFLLLSFISLRPQQMLNRQVIFFPVIVKLNVATYIISTVKMYKLLFFNQYNFFSRDVGPPPPPSLFYNSIRYKI